MSKIIVLNDEAFDSLVGTLKQAMDDSKCLADWLNAKAHAELIESQKDARRSVIEWHPMSEKPETGLVVLVRTNENNVFTNVSDDYKFWSKKTLIEWAYLPE